MHQQTCSPIKTDNLVHERERDNDLIKHWHTASYYYIGQISLGYCKWSRPTNKSSVSTLWHHSQPEVIQHNIIITPSIVAYLRVLQ